MTRFLHYLAQFLWPRGRLRRRTSGGVGEKEQEGHAKETSDLVSSWGRWPGHEANFPALSRLLWEIGKSKEKTTREDEESRKPNHESRNK